MLFWILAGLAVYLFTIYLPATLYLPAEGLLAHAGGRDELPPASKMAERARKALVNTQENMPIFLTLAVLAMVVEGADMGQAILGAQLFVLARAAYPILYLISIPGLRSVAYGIGLFGCVLMALAVI